MNISLLFLALIAILILLIGILAVAAIISVCHRCNCKSDNKKKSQTDQNQDPWKEAGRRQQ
ncbi:MAG: hypothetical protein QF444_05855 [Phycisphaerales bacterium]|nr:hypothetical protein [Phycisphaerales bacterium]